MPISAHTGKIVEAESSRPAIAVSLNTEYLSSFQEKIEKYTEKRRFSAIFLLFYALVGRFSRTGARKKRIAAAGLAPLVRLCVRRAARRRGGACGWVRARGWVFGEAWGAYYPAPDRNRCFAGRLSRVRPAEAAPAVRCGGAQRRLETAPNLTIIFSLFA